MTSGQCTMGAMKNCSLCAPSSSTSPSPTVMQRPSKSMSPKNCGSIFAATWVHTTVMEGYFSIAAAIIAEWSGSRWWTTR